MATDYDTPKKSEEETDSIEALKEQVPEKSKANVDTEESDEGFELAGSEVVSGDINVVILPQQETEFACVECFLVKHHSQKHHAVGLSFMCTDCYNL